MIRLLRSLSVKNIWLGWKSSLAGLAVAALCGYLVYSGKATLAEACEAAPVLLVLLLSPDKMAAESKGLICLALGLILLTGCAPRRASTLQSERVEKTTRTRTLDVPVPSDSSTLVIEVADLQPTDTGLGKTWTAPGVAQPGQIWPNDTPSGVFATPTARLLWRKKSTSTRSHTTAELYSDGRLHIRSHCDSLMLQVAAQDSIIKQFHRLETTVPERKSTPSWIWLLAGLAIGILLTTLWRILANRW